MKVNKKLFFSITIGLIVFLCGFGTMFLFYSLPIYNNTSLPGLFHYKTALIGDSICLPLLTASLYYSCSKNNTNKKSRASVLIGLIFGLLGTIIQAKWLLSNSTNLNWTIPKPHYFNCPGWCHAVFFITMFFTLGFLFTKLWISNRNTISKEYSFAKTLIWFSSSLFAYFYCYDHVNNKNILIYFLMTILIVFFAYAFNAASYKTIRIPKNEIISILSGVFTALPTVVLFTFGCKVNIWYLLSCSLIIFVLVPISEKNDRNMIISYLTIASPTVLLEASISTQSNILFKVILFALVLVISSIITLCQNDDYEIKTIRKVLFCAVVVIVSTTLFCGNIITNNIENSSLFETVINTIFAFLIPQFVKKSFDNIIKMENSEGVSIKKIKAKQERMYFIYTLICIGTVLLIGTTIFPKIPICTKDYNFTYLLCGVFSLLVLLLVTKAFEKKTIIKEFFNILLIIVITILFEINFVYSSLNIDKVTNGLINRCVMIVGIIEILFYCVLIGKGFINNTCKIRGIKAYRRDYYYAVLLSLCGFVAITSSLLEMITTRTILSIAINIIILMIFGIIIPYFISLEKDNKIKQPQLTKNIPSIGVAQDGLLFSMLLFFSQMVLLFLSIGIPQWAVRFDTVVEKATELFVFLLMINWPITYCIENNVKHFNQRYEEYRLVNVSKKNKRFYENQEKALLKHLRMQNGMIFGISIPFSLITLFSMGITHIMSDKSNFFNRIFPSENNDIYN